MRSVQNILGAFLRCLAEQNDQVASTLGTMLDEKCQYKQQPDQLSVEQAKSCLLSAAQSFNRVRILIDALDESLARETLLPLLSELINSPGNNFKLLVTSRREADIEAEFAHFPTVCLNATTNTEDIRLYVSTQIERRIEKGMFQVQNPRLIETLISQLVTRAEGL
jgi:hypothetical protein